MLDEHRRMEANTAPLPEEELPDLDPTMFLSAAGRNELRAASQLQGPAAPIRLPDHADLGTIGVPRNQGATASSVAHAVAAAIELESLWSTPFTDETMASAPIVDNGLGIEFDAEGHAPIEGVRFQIGRQDPPRQPFYSAVRSGPSEGEVVSRRVGQRFETVENHPVPAPREPVRHVAAKEPPPAPVVRRSVWERLMDDD